ncbi:uncharacterized protein LOC112347826 [Selaginella moellendorffii]|uniref:uncharacterized protein LOC112342343 n=1 Tax=Selaginella moellendorffii TaxID=88036 RepID=UPI000D1C87D6|nr:uncharacterized protein LOC112342343 [Selaginella moellendorffii]XP_024535092.1 uncharacterized protein LOC112347826 [Selaginella moellendorffii]|eukprot:XP_024519789.1 uncharacterized protein LOC112342343 [Selaginella moellendorffii]
MDVVIVAVAGACVVIAATCIATMLIINLLTKSVITMASSTRGAAKEDLQALRGALKEDLQALRGVLKEDLPSLRQVIQDFGALREELRMLRDALRAEAAQGQANPWCANRTEVALLLLTMFSDR